MELISTYSSCQWAGNKTKGETAQPVTDEWEAKCDCAYAVAHGLLRVDCKESLQDAQSQQICIWELVAICYFPFLTTGFSSLGEKRETERNLILYEDILRETFSSMEKN